MPRNRLDWLNWLSPSDKTLWGQLEVAYRDCLLKEVEIKGRKAELRAKAAKAKEEFESKRVAA